MNSHAKSGEEREFVFSHEKLDVYRLLLEYLELEHALTRRMPAGTANLRDALAERLLPLCLSLGVSLLPLALVPCHFPFAFRFPFPFPFSVSIADGRSERRLLRARRIDLAARREPAYNGNETSAHARTGSINF